MRPLPQRLVTTLSRLTHRLGALTVVAALVAGCSASGRVALPTAAPARLLDPTAQPTPIGTAAATALPNGTPAPTATPAPARRSLTIVGTVESVAGEIWLVDGLRVRVPPAVPVAPGLGAGSLVRITASVQDDDDDDQSLVALSVEPVREVVLVGELLALDAATITVDGRVLVLPAGFVLPAGLVPGAIVRVVVDDDDGALLVRVVQPVVEARILGGTVELIDDGAVVIGGQRLILAPDVLLWRVRLVVGEPVRIIVVPVDGVLTIVAITIVTIVVPPPVVVLPIAPPVVNPPPAPRPPAPPSRPSNSDDDDDDDDDD